MRVRFRVRIRTIFWIRDFYMKCQPNVSCKAQKSSSRGPLTFSTFRNLLVSDTSNRFHNKMDGHPPSLAEWAGVPWTLVSLQSCPLQLQKQAEQTHSFLNWQGEKINQTWWSLHHPGQLALTWCTIFSKLLTGVNSVVLHFVNNCCHFIDMLNDKVETI